MNKLIVLLALSLASASAFAQSASTPSEAPTPQSAIGALAVSGSGEQDPPTPLLLGVGDLVEIRVYGAPDLNTETRISSSGEISLPLIGQQKLAGLSAEQAQGLLESQLQEGKFLLDPHVSVFVKEYATQGVSVLGEVTKPGTYPLLGTPRLLDAISAAGGTTARAGSVVQITRRKDPNNPINVPLRLGQAGSGDVNPLIFPGDTVVVSKAGLVYVVGEVTRPSGFIMENNETMTVLQAMALAGGSTRVSSLNNARIIRKIDSEYTEIPVQLGKILSSKSPDINMRAGDILFVPASGVKRATYRSFDTVLQITTGIAIYGGR